MAIPSSIIPVADLPLKSIGEFDTIVGVDESEGSAARFPGSGLSDFITFKASGANTVSRPISEKLDDFRTIEDWHLESDGSNWAIAFLKMAEATGGTVILKDKEYTVGNLVMPEYERVMILGESRPVINSGRTKLEKGTILVGGVSVRANQVIVDSVGVDSGSARGFAIDSVDGLVINSKLGQSGSECVVSNAASLGPGQAGTSHRFLIQGFNSGSASNILCAEGQYGLVVKSRNFNIKNVHGFAIRTGTVYPKSDTPDFGGDVGDATAGNINIDGVVSSSTSDNVDCAAVYVHASTLGVAKVNVSNVHQLYGHSALRIQGPGTLEAPPVSGVNACNLLSEGSQYGFYAGGYCYDWRVVNSHAINPTTGRSWYMDTSTNWEIISSGALITNSALGTVLGNANGNGCLHGIYARRPDAQMTITISAVPSAIKNFQTGYLSGNLRYSIDQNLIGQNGAVADTARVPTFRLAPGGKAELNGRIKLDAAVNKFFCNLPITTGFEYSFPATYIDSNSAFQTCAIRLNSFQLSIEPALPSGAKYVILDGISITL